MPESPMLSHCTSTSSVNLVIYTDQRSRYTSLLVLLRYLSLATLTVESVVGVCAQYRR